MKPFFDYHGLEYEKKTVVKHGSGYELCPYSKDCEWRKKQKPLLHIETRLDHYKKQQLTATGQKTLMRKGKETKLSKQLSNDLYNYFQNIRHTAPPLMRSLIHTCKQNMS